MRLIRFQRAAPAPPPARPGPTGETGEDSAERAEVGLLFGPRILRLSPLWALDHSSPLPDDPVTILTGDAGAWCRDLTLAEPGHMPEDAWVTEEEVRLLSPAARPGSFRDFYSFEEHVRAARARRGLQVPEEWYAHPTFYYSNPRAIQGSGEVILRPAVTRALDFEMEIGCVLGRGGRDLTPEAAAAHIAGYTLLNDWSAREIQQQEMTVGLGPAKGKDFATSLGPVLVTPDEIAPLRRGKGYDLALEARRNGEILSRGNWSAIRYSFEEMIAYASRDVWLYPGDLFGSGTVGSGCLLELGPEEHGGWLEPGDLIEISGDHFGTLRNRIGPTPGIGAAGPGPAKKE